MPVMNSICASRSIVRIVRIVRDVRIVRAVRDVRAVRFVQTGGLVALLLVLFGTDAGAHGVAGKDAVFLQGLEGRAIVPMMYLGAKHMVTGYDHLLFLVGVI